MATPGTPFAAYTTPSAAQPLTAAKKTALKANLDLFKALLPNPAVAASAPHSDFDLIHPETSRKLRAEIDSIKAFIDLVLST